MSLFFFPERGWPGRRILALRLLTATVFLLSGVGKMLDESRISLVPMLLGGSTTTENILLLASTVERAVPALEIIVGFALLTRVGVRSAALLGAGLGAVFLLVAWTIPSGASCRYFGLLGSLPGRSAHLLVAVLVLLSSALVAFEEIRHRWHPPAGARNAS
jgi:uncharacterized membrane protein YphA (DoxX/SURF4 family)